MGSGMGGWTHRWDAPVREGAARAEYAFAGAPPSTLSGSEARRRIGDKFRARATNQLEKTCKTSGRAAVYGLGGGSIRKKIIGHRMCSIPSGFGGRKHVGHPRRAFALFKKPACQHRGGIFLHPLIDQRDNFLAEIGGVGEARQFKTLQGVP